MAGIQVIGKDATLKTYEAYDIDTWGLFQDKRPLAAGSGSEELSKWLDIFEPAGSTGQYTLRLYADIPPEQVDMGTAYRFCFVFKLYDTYGGQGVIGGYHTIQMQQEIASLKKQLEEGGSDDEPDLNDTIMGYLENPTKLGQFIGAIKQIWSNNPAEQVSGVTHIGNTNQPEGTSLSENDATIERLAAVIDRLEKADKNILDHLEKLAEMAEKNPNKFNMAISML